MSKANGGSAFPFIFTDTGEPSFSCQGMTLRDYFAAKAMSQGMAILTAHGTNLNGHQLGELAKTAYMAADAMLAEREKGGDE
jgi:hypothetical protein